MYAISLLQGMVFYGPIATLYRRAAGISIFQITIIESISLIVCLLLELPWGIVADKIGYKILRSSAAYCIPLLNCFLAGGWICGFPFGTDYAEYCDCRYVGC